MTGWGGSACARNKRWRASVASAVRALSLAVTTTRCAPASGSIAETTRKDVVSLMSAGCVKRPSQSPTRAYFCTSVRAQASMRPPSAISPSMA
jgi:hypothetical protein